MGKTVAAHDFIGSDPILEASFTFILGCVIIDTYQGDCNSIPGREKKEIFIFTFILGRVIIDTYQVKNIIECPSQQIIKKLR